MLLKGNGVNDKTELLTASLIEHECTSGWSCRKQTPFIVFQCEINCRQFILVIACRITAFLYDITRCFYIYELQINRLSCGLVYSESHSNTTKEMIKRKQGRQREILLQTTKIVRISFQTQEKLRALLLWEKENNSKKMPIWRTLIL